MEPINLLLFSLIFKIQIQILTLCLESFSTKGGSLQINFNKNVMDFSLEQKFVDMLPNIKQLCLQ